MGDFRRSSDAIAVLRRVADRAVQKSTLVEETFLDSRRADDYWGPEYFPTLEEEYRYRTLALVREARRVFGALDHDAFLQLGVAMPGVKGVFAAAWHVGNVVLFVSLRRPSPRIEAEGSHFSVVLGAFTAPPLADPEPGPGSDEARDAVVVRMPLHAIRRKMG